MLQMHKPKGDWIRRASKLKASALFWCNSQAQSKYAAITLMIITINNAIIGVKMQNLFFFSDKM